MANIIRSAKPGSDWSTNDLLAYNITIQTQTVVDFFGHELSSPIDHLDPILLSPFDPNILSLDHSTCGISVQTYRFLEYLNTISCPNAPDYSELLAFANSVLEVTDFDRQIGMLLLMLYTLPLTICGDNDCKAIPDICLLSNQRKPVILLLVQLDRDNRASGLRDPVPPVIAGAIATFQYNNRNRAEMGLPTLDKMIIPCITVEGTRPQFHKVPVTQHLSDCVATGQFPTQKTVVTCCGPPAPPDAYEGMEFPDYRYTTFRYYDAFRDLAEQFWAPFLTGCERSYK